MAFVSLRPAPAHSLTGPTSMSRAVTASQPPANESKKTAGTYAKDALLLTGTMATGHTLATVAFSGTTPEATSFIRPVTDAVKAQIGDEMAQLGVDFRPNVKVDWKNSFVKDGSTTLHLNRYKFSPLFRQVSQRSMESTSFMHLARHETGHALFNVAMKPSLANQYRAAFGASAKASYDMTFWTQLTTGLTYSKSPDFVSKYAQTHAAEDFAETFGVYMRLGGNKAAIRNYVAEAGESAIMKAKFSFVDDLVKLASRL